ncbi:hypothetical protein [Nonomuraea sp. SYSU D8015]|uniref:hypothetical protein n=1 Tax=Nonomuraea sp. SYSU D8015 TaxID=2593644 RepID=UPI001660FD75|nr:hypothetical protein [Nonomuraea sp. SYSU D8015]
MRRLVVVLAAVLLPLAIASPATAKLVERGTLTGPGLSRPIEIKPGTAADDRRLNTVRTGTAVNNTLLEGLPDVFSAERPDGRLGPRYRIDWYEPGDDRPVVVQYVYPYAGERPVVHTPAQKNVVSPGWMRAPAYLKSTLRALGLPAKPPAQARPSPSPSCS